MQYIENRKRYRQMHTGTSFIQKEYKILKIIDEQVLDYVQQNER